MSRRLLSILVGILLLVLGLSFLGASLLVGGLLLFMGVSLCATEFAHTAERLSTGQTERVDQLIRLLGALMAHSSRMGNRVIDWALEWFHWADFVQAHSAPRKREMRDVAPMHPPPARQVSNSPAAVAASAMRAAGHEPAATQIQVTDIGILATHAGGEQTTHRLTPIDDQVERIQPFVQLELPVIAAGDVDFVLFDEVGEERYACTLPRQFERGRSMIIADPPFMLAEQRERGSWTLDVYADKVLLASHAFRWMHDRYAAARQRLSSDGELNLDAMPTAASNRPAPRLSLDDLLADQDVPARRRERR